MVASCFLALISPSFSLKRKITALLQWEIKSFPISCFPFESSQINSLSLSLSSSLSLPLCLFLVGRLNWWTTTGKLPRLEPLATSGDGNCLLHAASLYMWGLHDRQLILRTSLHRQLTSSRESERIRRRWRYQTQLRNNEAGGLTFSEEEWDFEWGEIIRIATNQPRRQPTTASLRRYSSLRFSYESLEEIHIFALAHVLRRPVIVIADNAIKNLSGEDLAPIYFGGIYLPLEINATACSKTPVVLAYDASHFSPLVARRDTLTQQPRMGGRFSRLSSRTETVIPLVSPTGSLLPVQFIIDPKNRQVAEKWGEMKYSPGEFPDEIVHILDHYLKIRWIQLNVSSVSQSTDQDYDHLFPVEVPKVRFPAAVIFQDSQPIYQKELIEKYLENIRERYAEEKEKLAERERERERRLQEVPVPCEGAGCDMFGKGATNNLCSRCYQKWQKAKAGGWKETEEEVEGERESQAQLKSPEIVLEVEVENGSDHQFNASYPPPLNRPPPYRPPPSLPPKGVPPKQLPPVQSPPKQFSNKALPPIQPPPSHPPPVYSASASSHQYIDSDDDLHREKHQRYEQHQLQNKSTTFPVSSSQPQTESKSDKKSSPNRSVANTTSPSDNSTTANGSKSKPKTSPAHSVEVSGKDKPWTKKFNLFTNISPFSKPTATKSGSGYTRDSIQPIKLAEGGGTRPSTLASGSQRIKCVNSGCEFFGCAEKNGYCSSCFKQIEQHGPVVAV